MELKLIRITCQAACHGRSPHEHCDPSRLSWQKLNMDIQIAACDGKTEHGRICHSLKNQQNCCRPTCRCHHLGYSVPSLLALDCCNWFAMPKLPTGPRGPGLEQSQETQSNWLMLSALLTRQVIRFRRQRLITERPPPSIPSAQSLKRFCALYRRQITLRYEKKVSKLYYLSVTH